MKEPEVQCSGWTERYEALRAHFTGEAPLAATPLELALLLQRGMAAWMTVKRSAAGVEAASMGPPNQCLAAESGTGLEIVRGELVRVLAAAALTVAERRGS